MKGRVTYIKLTPEIIFLSFCCFFILKFSIIKTFMSSKTPKNLKLYGNIERQDIDYFNYASNNILISQKVNMKFWYINCRAQNCKSSKWFSKSFRPLRRDQLGESFVCNGFPIKRSQKWLLERWHDANESFWGHSRKMNPLIFICAPRQNFQSDNDVNVWDKSKVLI